MATIKVKFRPSAIDGKPGHIIYRISHRQIVRQITTKYNVFPTEWDGKQLNTRNLHDNRKMIVQQISSQIAIDIKCLYDIANCFEQQRHSYSSDDIVAEFKNPMRTNTLFEFMKRIISRLENLSHTGTARNYRAALNSIKRFRNNQDISLGAIDTTLIEDYQGHLKTFGLSQNSITFYLRIIRAVYNRAVSKNLVQDRHPFQTVSTTMTKTMKRAISIADIRRIKNIDLSNKSNLQFARDVFLFLLYCRGMSFIDAAYLKKTDIQRGIISYRRSKTGQHLHIKVICQIRDICNQYQLDESPYLLPIILNPHGDTRKQYESALRRINNGLKMIGTMINLQIPLTTYCARHTWATIAKAKNISINVISDALGHDSISTTSIYLASLDASAIDKANEVVVKSILH